VALTIGDYNTGVIVGVFVVALYAVGSYATTARLIAALVGIVVAMGIVAWSEPPDLDAAGAVWTAMISAGAAATGFVVRRDRERRDARIADHEEAGVAESRRARLAATTERLRIAEELNHVITRSMQSISTSANSGSRIVESDPPAALALLESISTVSRDALGDLRRLLKRMHADAEPAPHAPVLTPTTPSTPAGAR
jgi:signal transduction histidine kinase